MKRGIRVRVRPLIKICGVRSVVLAEECVAAGSDFVGIICHPESSRYVALQNVAKIAAAVIAQGGTPVAVFVDQDAEQMLAICETAGIDVVQLHGATARRHHQRLPAHYQRIYVSSVLPSGELIADKDRGLRYCDPTRDYGLVDTLNPGTGQVLNWSGLQYSWPLRMGLAGGLTSQNVGHAIQQVRPSLVDVSSGVERVPGEKDIRLIREFIDAVTARG